MAGSMRSELQKAYAGKRVLLTGHTGFKGGWLALWLHDLGAVVHGLALEPNPGHVLFRAAAVESVVRHRVGDVRQFPTVRIALDEASPDFVFHLAAQPIVRESYVSPLATVETNVLGTVHILEAIRLARNPCSVVVVTSDKAYENRERVEGYREGEAMGGYDLYSASKGAAEILTAAYRRSFFHPERIAEHRTAIATARAGNVVGGGDWAQDRIVPDAVNALAEGRPIPVRNPNALRPWQHVLEPLGGYLVLGVRLAAGGGERFAEAWNFGPEPEDVVPVRDLVDHLVRAWGSGSWNDRSQADALHEATVLRLDIEKARSRLGWHPRWRIGEAMRRTAEWYRAYHAGVGPSAMRDFTVEQIHDYEGTAA
jgi:CDP-glucose 4,6-dehydratase